MKVQETSSPSEERRGRAALWRASGTVLVAIAVGPTAWSLAFGDGFAYLWTWVPAVAGALSLLAAWGLERKASSP